MVGGKLLGNGLTPFEHVFAKAWSALTPNKVMRTYVQNYSRKIFDRLLTSKFDQPLNAGSKELGTAIKSDFCFLNIKYANVLNLPDIDWSEMREAFGHSGE
jgi:hypothetical protein